MEKYLSIRQLLLPAAFLILVLVIALTTNKKDQNNGLLKYDDYRQSSEPPSVEYFRKIYANPQTGEMGRPSPIVQRYWTRMIEAQKLEKSGIGDEIEWVEVGPTNVGGRTRAIAMDRQNPDRLIAGGVRGGIWVTDNHGDRWEHVKGITENESITYLIQHPNQAEKWYASTGEYIGSGANFFGGGLLYSTDNGNNWDVQHYAYQFDDALNDYVYKTIPDIPISSAGNPERLEGYPFQYASKILANPTSNSIFVATHGWGILKSTDDIQSFTHNWPPNPERYARQELPVDTSTTLLLRFDGDLEGEQGEMPLDASEIDFREGVFGQGAHLDTLDILQYASAGNVNSLSGTVEFWIQPDWNGNNGQEHLFWEFGEFPFAISIRRINDWIEILYARGDGEEWYGAGSFGNQWKAGEWHHLAFTWDAEAVSAYFDGSLVSAVPVTSLPEITRDFFQFGVPWGDGVGGVIDEFRISDRARTADEINQSFQFGTFEEAVVAYPAFRPEFSDISISSDGDLLAYLSGHRSGGSGLYQSKDDGESWIDITPDDWPDFVERGVIQHAPSNPEVAYLLMLSPGATLNFYKFDLNNGTGENRSHNMPSFTETVWPDQEGRGIFPGNYYLMMSVKPNDENFIVIGGVGMARTFDGFATLADTAYIHEITSNMHVDNHLVVFDPNDPDAAWAVNDGGIYYTDDINRISREVHHSQNYLNVQWQDKDNNYNVTQFYTVAQSNDPTDHRVTGGAQDNGYLTVAPPDPKQSWRAFGQDFGSDGAFVYMTPNYTYMSFQIGETYRLERGPDGNAVWENGWIGISPANQPGRDFIHPWVVDPNDENTMYYPINNKVYRIDEIDKVPNQTFYGEENFDLISDGAVDGYNRVSALAVSTTPAHTLYFATDGEKPTIKRVKNAQTENPVVEDVSITNAQASWTYTRCIAPNPEDGDEWLVVMTNYNVPSLYHTKDGGQTYELVEGNLAGTESIPGPSMEWAEILNFGGKKYYFLATRIGLFMTHELDGANTIWTHQGTETIGYALALMVQARESDGKIVVGTHGRGFFAGYLSEPITTRTNERLVANLDIRATPNPVRNDLQISFSLKDVESLSMEVLDLQGKVVLQKAATKYGTGQHTLQLSMSEFPAGLYFVRVGGEHYLGVEKVVKY